MANVFYSAGGSLGPDRPGFGPSFLAYCHVTLDKSGNLAKPHCSWNWESYPFAHKLFSAGTLLGAESRVLNKTDQNLVLGTYLSGDYNRTQVLGSLRGLKKYYI